jgi:hypothetical protein
MHTLLGIWNPPKWEAIEAVGTWVAAIGTMFAVAVALWLGQRDIRARRTERRGEIQAMMMEVLRGKSSMQNLLTDNIPAPLYRIPLTNFQRALPKLIADGRLDYNEIDTLIEYENRIEELNRGLERAGEAAREQARTPTTTGLSEEFERNKIKVRAILEDESPRFGGESLYEATGTALFRLERVYASWWGRLKLWRQDR